MNLGIENEVLEFKKSTGELKEAMYSIGAMLNKHQHGELYFANDVAKIRVADEDITMSPEQITTLILNSGREGNRWENLISNRTIDDVDEELLKIFTSKAHDAGRIAIYYTDKRTVLNQLELTNGERLLNAGKALFSDDIIQDVQMAIFATTERLTFNDIQRFHGPVLKLVDIAETYIKSNIHWRVEFTGTLERTEIPEIPMDAIREALLNSFCHKDYASGESNEVAIYKDRVEIYNPGAFPDGYDPQYFIAQPSRPIRRNPLIARTLYYSKDIESFGTGLKRIADVCEAAGVRYEFQKLKNGFVVCFYRSSYQSEESGGKVRVSTGKVRVNEEGLSESKKQIVNYVLQNSRITNKETCELLDVKDSRAYKLLKELDKAGVLKKEGSYRDSYYRIAEDKDMYHV